MSDGGGCGLKFSVSGARVFAEDGDLALAGTAVSQKAVSEITQQVILPAPTIS